MKRKPLLLPRHRTQRLKWCKERSHWTIPQWFRVFWSDEANFQVVNRKTKRKIRRYTITSRINYSQQLFAQRVQGGGGSVGIWGCFNYQGAGICHIYRGRMNQLAYREVLENALLPSVDLLVDPGEAWILQQDGSSVHTAGSIVDYLAVLPWYLFSLLTWLQWRAFGRG